MMKHNHFALIAVVVLLSRPDLVMIQRLLKWGDAGITDYRKFPAREMTNAPPTFFFEDGQAAGTVEKALAKIQYSLIGRTRRAGLEKFLRSTGTTGFIVIQNDKILYERYFNGYHRDSINTSFSMAKSVDSALIGIAIAEGSIGSVEDPVIKYIPELAGRGIDGLTLRHLLTMSSGLRYKETPPRMDDVHTYYHPDLRSMALSVEPETEPGRYFLYNNYNPLLIGMVLERATGRPVAKYLEEKIWVPLGMEFPASWSLDSEKSGFEKMESGINARTIDFAKIGRLFLRGGDWEGRQIIPADWVAESTRRDPVREGPDYYKGPGWYHPDEPGWYYKYFWWGSERPDGGYDFYAHGNKGQFIYISPDKDLIIVRNGKKYGLVDSWPEVLRDMAARL